MDLFLGHFSIVGNIIEATPMGKIVIYASLSKKNCPYASARATAGR
jgi:hypothetical protein